MPSATLLIRPFEAQDQDAARKLILDGLGHHFGYIDEACNPDLDDITSHYIRADHIFVVALLGSDLVGTGALIFEDERTGRMVSEAREHWRKGIGSAIVEHLIRMARRRGLTQVLMATEKHWRDAIGLYQRCGFVEYDRDEVDVHLSLGLG